MKGRIILKLRDDDTFYFQCCECLHTFLYLTSFLIHWNNFHNAGKKVQSRGEHSST